MQCVGPADVYRPIMWHSQPNFEQQRLPANEAVTRNLIRKWFPSFLSSIFSGFPFSLPFTAPSLPFAKSPLRKIQLGVWSAVKPPARPAANPFCAPWSPSYASSSCKCLSIFV